MKNIVGNLVGQKMLYGLLLGVAGIFLSSKDRARRAGFIFVLVVVPVALILCANIFAQYMFVPRQLIWVMPFFAIWLAGEWEQLFFYVENRLNTARVLKKQK